MKRHHFLDNMAWWFGLNVVAAILIVILMNMAFVRFAGVWGQPPAESAGLVEQAAGMARVMDLLPPASRASLADRLTTPALATHWYPRRELVPISARHDKDIHNARWAKITGMLHRPDAGIMAVDFSREADGHVSASNKYALAIELSDHSWIGFDTAQRSWGMSRSARTLLVGLFGLLSSSAVASVASRRLARPVLRLAKASDRFGSQSRAEPLELIGPLELREAAAAFNAMQERIERLVDSRTEMLTAISHDLRAPLTRLRLRGEFIEDAEQQHKLFNDVDEIQAMIEASLAFFRLDGQEEAMTRFEFGELIQTVLDDFRDLGQPVETAGLRQFAYLGRPLALKRALTNLVDNAVKYGNTATVTLSAQSRQLTITIDDAGAGVPPNLIPKLFQPFFRGEPSRNRATGGYGLGLPSALSIIRSHGGDLTLSNLEPHGLRAMIVLPVLG